MENAFQADPDIRGVITFNVNQAMAANNYICSLPGINYEEYGIFCNNTDDAVTSLIGASAANDGTSVLRGTIINDAQVAGSDETTAVAGLLLQGKTPPYDLVQPLWTINSVGYEL